MKKMKNQEVVLLEEEPKKNKKLNAIVILFCVGVMAAAVVKGVMLDKQEAAEREAKAAEENKED